MDVLNAFRLDGKVALVTGASAGLGAGFARTLAAAGADVALVARRAGRLAELAEKLRAAGTRVITHAADVGDAEQCRAAVAAVVSEFGRVDVLINNAGIGHAVPASRETPEGFAAVLRVNLGGPFWMAQACAPHMPHGSSIVNVASVLGHIAPPFPQAAYAASKAGVLGLTRDLAQEWSARKGIRVNALCPGYFASEMTENDDAQLREMVARNSMLARFGEQGELDGALLFLASSASSYVTGTSLIVDGGMAAL
ncbi:NAD(P)-dependent dehydrogenase (short-subunit alcohol dehydrogenase family) [Actinoplanes lutulentus]|uniref:NAD(P)-dependent dehydrogenase (Short-subunit alcohol dehydrogenase family) n=1 Tax=Actinoplanes lutulentus TaxID=1287878 RepID=A0A327Z5P3_9ACTN|nr:SDR family oxidoreductase [Actinoplanes lutulentus]MBB2946976.1 NAD(P)-dependent dehydrogenase (short-subunit alcohol dehydrogenase family) [Actinoplanes lutulentus]RAK30478.1 NAD(P)-dependent dehydrogenase (short-subunit alcohol dehydrogenase family) [Actinoplanes lutulentus]